MDSHKAYCEEIGGDGDNQFYRPKPRFIASRTATGSALLFSPEVREMEREVDYLEERFENMNAGEKALMGMLKLGNAFRFIEKLYREDAIDFPTRRMTGSILCVLYEGLRQDAFIWTFSRGNSENAGCK
jgi:hypothetical protein